MSAAWQFFELDDECSRAAKCRVCGKMVSRGGQNRASFNTTNLIRHLTRHPEEYRAFSAATKSEAAAKRHALLARSGKVDPWPARGRDKAGMITERLAEFIALNDQPVSLVESTGFRRLLDIFDPRYELPCRRYMTSTAIPQLYGKVRSRLRELLSDHGAAVSVTADLWTCGASPVTLLSLTAHWVDSAFEAERAVLHADEFRGAHTADDVRQALGDVLREWGLDKQRVHVILHDSTRTMKTAVDDMGVPSLGCVAHALERVVHEGVLSQQSVTDTLASVREIVAHFRHSAESYARLEDIQVEMKMPKKRLQQDVQVGWNSTFLMVQSILEQKRPLSVFASEHDLPATLSSNQWALMEKMVTVLAPFEEIARSVSEQTATAADVIPAVTVLRRVLSREQDGDQGVRTMKNALLEALNKHFEDVEREPICSIATLLDPRYKGRYFSSPQNLRAGKAALIEELENGKPFDEALEAKRVKKEPLLDMAGSGLGSVFEEILNESEKEAISLGTSLAIVQLETYLAEPTIPRSDNPLHYWKSHATKSPSLAAAAAKFLCAPCTSVDSERLFRSVLHADDETRNCPSADMAQMRVFLKKNLHFIMELNIVA